MMGSNEKGTGGLVGWHVRVFISDDKGALVPLRIDADLEEEARAKAGTVRIENMAGKQLWPDQ